MGRGTRLVGLATIALAMSACGGATGPEVTGDGSTATPVGAWELRDAEPPIDVPDDARVTLEVEAVDGQLRAGGTAACNSYGGRLRAADGAWSLDELSWTEMGCDEPRMAAEAAYLEALQGVDAWLVDGDALRLTGPDVRLTFDRLAPVATAELTDTTWVLDGLVEGTGDSAAISSVPADVAPAELRLDPAGTFTLFTGCRDFAGDWTTSGDEVVLPSWGQTDDSRGVTADGSLDCGPAAEALERAVLDVVEGGFTADVDEQRLTLRSGAAGLVLRPA